MKPRRILLRAPNPLLVLEGVSAGYRGNEGERIVLSGIDFSLQSGERYGLLGVNGAGKSTFIKTIARTLAPLAGEAVFNKGLQVGYFAQHQLEMLDDAASPLLHLQRLAKSTAGAAREQDLRDFLGSFDFSGDMALEPIATFSGGEKARLALALIVWQRPNLLLLDEPTNHLDLETREALTVALAQFEGTLVLVSHDRHLLRATTEQFLIVADGRLRPFDGDLDDYRDWLLKSKTGTTQDPPAAEQKKPPRKGSGSQKALESRIKRLEELIARLNQKKAEIESRLGDPALYQDPSRQALDEALSDRAHVAREGDGGTIDNWDMQTVNETGAHAGRFLYRSHEVPTNGMVSVTDLQTGVTSVLAQRVYWDRLDGIVWTPWQTLLAATRHAADLCGVLDEYPDAWPIVRGLIPKGVWYEQAEVGSSPSLTPPIHATLGTGAFPRHHGVVDARLRFRGGLARPEETWPQMLTMPTLADLYDRARGNQPKVGVIAYLTWHLGMVGYGSFMRGGDQDIALLRRAGRWVPAGKGRYYRFPAYARDIPTPSDDPTRLDRQDDEADGKWFGLDVGVDDEGTRSRIVAAEQQTSVIEEVIRREGFGADEVPDLLFVIDTNKEEIAVKEARKLGIPVIAVIDTNCDPDDIDYIIPGNDDAIRAIRLFASRIADACVEGVQERETVLRSDAEGGETAAFEEAAGEQAAEA